MPEPYRATAISPDTEPAATDVVPAGEDVPTQRFYPMPAGEGEPVRLVTNKAIAQQAAPGREIAEIEVPRTHLDERSEEHTSELQSLMRNSYAVLRLKKKNN